MNEVPYKDKNKEKQKEGLREKREEKFERKQLIKQEVEHTKPQRNISKHLKKQKKKENDWDEWADLQKEEKLFKKLKQGKITLKEFNLQVYGDSDFDEE